MRSRDRTSSTFRSERCKVSKNFELLQHAGRDLERRQEPSTVFGLSEPSSPRTASVPLSSAEENRSNWLRLVMVLRKRWRLSALFAGGVITTVAIVTFLIKPIYEPTARIEIDPPGEVFSLENNSSATSDTAYLETQAQNLRSDNLAVAVIRSLKLDQNRELTGSANTVNVAKSNATAGALELSPAESAALENFQTTLKIKRDTSSRLILISFASHDPQLAAQITNAVVDAFIEETFRIQHAAVMKSTEWLSRQLDDIRANMESSSRDLAQFQSSIGVADLDENKSTYTEHMGELSRQLTQAQSERIQLEAMLKNMQSGNPDSLPEVRNNPVVQQLSQRLAEQKAELAQALVVYGKNHPTAKKLQSEVDELQSQLDAQKQAAVNSVRTSYAAAEARERLMSAEMRGTSKELDQMARYTALKKQVQTNVDLYNSLYSKIKEAGIAAASKSGNIRVVDQARVLDHPTFPNRTLNLSVGLLVALLGGVLLAFLREEFDNKLHTPEDLARWTGTWNVAVIPAIGDSNGNANPFGGRLLRAGDDNHEQARAFMLDSPNSPEAEALHSLHASIMLGQRGVTPQVLLITSSFPGEGKTTVALNLALALARQGQTCLVDGDLRKRTVSNRFGLRSDRGLADFLAETAVLEDVLHSSGVNNLTVIPAGNSQTNPSQLLCSPNAQQLFPALRQRYRFVVVDSVPVIPFADGRALSPLADALVFVGRAGVATREAMRRSVQLLEEVHSAPILEFVLNGADMALIDYNYYGYGYSQEKSAYRES